MKSGLLFLVLVLLCVKVVADMTVDVLFYKKAAIATPEDAGRILVCKVSGHSWSAYEWGVLSPPSGIVLTITTQVMEESAFASVTDVAGTTTYWYVNNTTTPVSLTTTALVDP